MIPPLQGPDCFLPVLGWDCGPANTLIDLAVQRISHGALAFDHDGLIAASGTPNEAVIENWLKEPFFQKTPPKSTGREIFGLQDLERRINQVTPISSEDLIATLTTFSAAIVAHPVNRHCWKNRVSAEQKR